MAMDSAQVAPEWRRPPPTAAQQRADVLVGLGLAVAAVVSFELARSVGLEFKAGGPGRVEQTLWALAVTLPLMVRRRYPIAVMGVVASAYIGLQARLILEGYVSSIALFLAVFTVGAWATDRRIGTAARVVVVVAMFAWVGIALSTTAWQEQLADRERTGLLAPATATLIFVFLTNLAYFAAAWVFGDRAWRHARDRAELVTRNAELAAERHENARRAVMEERVRIARELHDVVAHHVSVMGVQAGAARHVLDSRPEAAREALAAIESSSRSAVDEMRKLLGVLRQGGDVGDPSPPGGDRAGAAGPGATAPDGAPGSRAPLPGVGDLPELVARLDHPASLTAAFTEVGAARPLPAAVSVSVYRIAQEALTNTVKHANARRVDVRLRWLESEVEIEVVDDGRGATAGSPTPSSGLGLMGMRERVALHRGEFEAGPRAVGGYRVRARGTAPADASPPARRRDPATEDSRAATA